MTKTPEEIAKAMELCRYVECVSENRSCPYEGEADCMDKAHDDAIEMIKRIRIRRQPMRNEIGANNAPDEDNSRSLEENMMEIRALLPKEEMLAQLAEECAELGQAALKFRRVMDGTNPTPVGKIEAFRKLWEETCDVIGCLWVLGVLHKDYKTTTAVNPKKFARWVRRLEAREDE